ncbi:MAG: acetolactate synthase [Planctomyces sp.]|nr:acetolactate synthase [Planctomyces sp.]
MQGLDWPCLRQFCVFLENRVGRLNDLMRLVESMDTRVIAVSLVDSVDFAIARLMFSNADRAREKLELSGFPFSESDVIGVLLPDGDKPFTNVCTQLVKAEINIHHAYPLLFRKNGMGAVALFVDDNDRAAQALRAAGLEVLTDGALMEDDEHF